MGLYNFQKRFVPFILSGAKQHTIRATRKNVDVPGNVCHLYTGLRQPGAILLGRFPCTRVEVIDIFDGGHRAIIVIDDTELDQTESERLARLDGFRSLAEMKAFWHGRLPFTGNIIHWKWSKGDTGYDITHGITR